MSETDRHKVRRLYQSGAKKRKEAKQRSDKEAEVVSKTRRLTEFITQLPVPQSDPVLSTSSVPVLEDAVENSLEATLKRPSH